MKNLFFEKRCRYSIRKLSIGACSLMIGSALFASPALAEQVAVPETATNTSAQATSCLLYTSFPSLRRIARAFLSELLFLVATSWMLLSRLANSSLAFCVPVSPKVLARDSILDLVEVQ